MTRDEAKNWLNKLYARADITDEYGDMEDTQPYEEAVDMAIKALEQQPCEDAISRQAVLDAIDVKAWEFCDYLISKNRNDEQKPVSHFADNLRECVREELPSVSTEKTGRWHKTYDSIVNDYFWECDNCKCGFQRDYPYCPNCGCHMVEP